jgi:muramoyltetrapeptide carboxypeptidase LdcA involved in peptidoglycan recycling
MPTIYPKALKPGDEVRVIAPSNSSLSVVSAEGRQIIANRFESELGLKLSFSRNVDVKGGATVEQRVGDLHDAFADKNVKAVISVLGGFNGEELLESIDFSLIKRNPKVFCGYSDVDVLSNAIYAKTGLVTFCGPHYASFAMKRGFDYTQEQWKKAVMGTHRFQVLPSANWSEDAWYIDQEKREFLPNAGLKTLKAGKATGTIVGGNLSTIILLGRVYMPKLEGALLFVEECSESGSGSFDKGVFLRNFGLLTRTPGFDKIKGLVFGRFPKAFKWDDADSKELISRRLGLASRNIPIIYGADFGHTTPIFTFGIGGTAEIVANESSAQIFFEPFVKE